ncbi:hypothetical protein [Chryseobacterium salivictor]|uniref:Uncharacterized protein n=1 Tax=Chryseobacterium salivictor TaxID=2547600 RepID=A0A4P6ZGW9_9FLAO|nr:hypothetical protein [Chryseobacterium salivictor]QBO58787.1 hypothetical protein NBC122_01979 [Chryseobacterium salivictor]
MKTTTANKKALDSLSSAPPRVVLSERQETEDSPKANELNNHRFLRKNNKEEVKPVESFRYAPGIARKPTRWICSAAEGRAAGE